MTENNQENPFLTHYDRLLTLCREFDITLSLGDGLRPGSLHDATDAAQIQELIVLGELTRRAWQADVQVMVEGPGHVPLNEVVTNMQLQKKLCHGAPFYVLGPLVTDVAPGYRSHHLGHRRGPGRRPRRRFPLLRDPGRAPAAAGHERHEGGDHRRADRRPCRRRRQGAARRHKLGQRDEPGRKDLDWQRMFDLAIDPDKARAYRASSQPGDQEVCTMCGDLCAVRKSRMILEGK